MKRGVEEVEEEKVRRRQVGERGIWEILRDSRFYLYAYQSVAAFECHYFWPF